MRDRDIKTRVHEIVTVTPSPVTVAFLSDATGKPKAQIRACLHRLHREGKVRAIRTKGIPAKLWISGPSPEVRAAQIVADIQDRMLFYRNFYWDNQVIAHCLPLLQELKDLLEDSFDESSLNSSKRKRIRNTLKIL
jgi:hypothetical protein